MPLYKLGKKPFVYNPRTLRLADYRSPSLLPPIPANKDWTDNRTQWGMMKNDTVGDCAIAGPGHAILGWTQNTGTPVVVPDSQIVAAYSAVSGYNPATGVNDNGCNLVDVLNYWRQTGIGGHKIDAYVALETGNKDHVKETLLVFGTVLIGVALPISAQNQPSWVVAGPTWNPDCQPGSWGGHCVIVVEYDKGGLTVVTWGQLMRMSWEFWDAYCDEAYAILSPDWLKAGKSPAGIDMASLQSDLAAVTG
jgi:hypothetical protein